MSTAGALVALAAVVAGCGSSDVETACSDAEARIGHRVCVHAVNDAGTWSSIATPAAATDQVRATAYLVPARSDARLPALFIDATAFDPSGASLHFQFLSESFPEFQLLDPGLYLELVLDPDRREFFAGSLTEFIRPGGESVYGFTIADAGAQLAATVTCDEIREVFREIEGRVTVGEVAFVPLTSLQRERLQTCDVPSYDPSTALEYEVYTSARGCGTVRRYTVAELATAQAQGDFGFQDILVLDEAPLDIETIVSGIVTGTRQGELSHLNVRSASRGTPNCYIRDAYAVAEMWEGDLVEIECAATELRIAPITPAEAQACWDDLRPDPVVVVPADVTFNALVDLALVPTADAPERLTSVGRFGSKGSNLATLYQRIDPALQLDGFVIPFHYYDAFVRGNSWTIDLGGGPEVQSFAETIDRLLLDASFLSDTAVRRARLDALRVAMQSAPCDQALIDALIPNVARVFGSESVMVRFRSSSNAEDALGFNGAGLYDSTSVCAADDTDADTAGPSRCDPAKATERGICRGLTRVWSSLWNMKAFEERAWYSIDQSAVAMAILVNTRTAAELANMVAFTGNPVVDGDDRYLVNAQEGELAVVSSIPGVWPEKDLLTIAGTAVVAIERVRGSTELPIGQWVLDDGELAELGAALATISALFPIDEPIPAGRSVLLDTEWKVRPDGRLAIKQIRPFLD